MDVVKRLRNALGNNRPSDATASSGGLADADADDVESLERLRDEARRACLEQMDSHLTQYLFEEQDRLPPPHYEEWIAALHPENATVTAGVVTKLDARFYKDQSDHRRLGNKYRPDARVDAVETSLATFANIADHLDFPWLAETVAFLRGQGFSQAPEIF